jgi:hypothetical protein
MSDQRDTDETSVNELDAVLEHLQQVKEDTVKLIFLMQKERARKTPKSSRAGRCNGSTGRYRFRSRV